MIAPGRIAVPHSLDGRIPPGATVHRVARRATEKQKVSADPNSDRVGVIRRRLALAIPHPQCELDHESPWQLLIATILSAQSTDRNVNKVTPELFKRWPSPAALGAAEREDVETMVRSTGFFRNKARAIQETSRVIAAEHDGEVPKSMDAMCRLPGVARKLNQNAMRFAGKVFLHRPVVDDDPSRPGPHINTRHRRLAFAGDLNGNRFSQACWRKAPRPIRSWCPPRPTPAPAYAPAAPGPCVRASGPSGRHGCPSGRPGTPPVAPVPAPRRTHDPARGRSAGWCARRSH